MIVLNSCGNDPQPTQSTRNLSMMDDSVIKYNKAVVKTEDQEIEDLMQRYGWIMVKSPTGLRYMIYKHGAGEKELLKEKK